MIVSRDVRGTVTIKLVNIPWDQVLDVILEDAGLGAIVEGNVMKISPLRTLRAMQEEIRLTARAREKTEPLITKIIRLRYARAEEVRPLVGPLLSPRGHIRVDLRTNSLLIIDTKPRVRAIEKLIKGPDNS